MAEKKTKSNANTGTIKRKAGNGRSPKKSTALKPMTDILPDEEIAQKAYLLWEERGRPFGSSEEDWFKAKEQLRA